MDCNCSKCSLEKPKKYSIKDTILENLRLHKKTFHTRVDTEILKSEQELAEKLYSLLYPTSQSNKHKLEVDLKIQKELSALLAAIKAKKKPTFQLKQAKSQLPDAGDGVFLVGKVPKGKVVVLYPSLVYHPDLDMPSLLENPEWVNYFGMDM